MIAVSRRPSTGAPGWLSRIVDLRPGEVRTLAPTFATLLLLIGAHTALETARDALLLTRFPARSLGVVYLAVAACVVPAAAVAARISARFGVRRALGGGLTLAAATLGALFVLPTTRALVIALYVTSGLVGAVLVPLYWNLVGSILTVAQGRRLLGPLGGAGVLGGTLGSGLAAALVEWLPAKALLLVSAGALALAMMALAGVPQEEETPLRGPPSVVGATRSAQAMRDEPFLRRIALLVVASTAAVVTVDYFFKWTVARAVPHEHVAQLIARFYLLLNVLSLVVQLFVSGRIMRRVGAAAAIVITPLVLLLGGLGALVSGGALGAVLVLRAAAGMLVNSMHRVTMELVYLPIPPTARVRAKPFIDGALARATQASVGALTLAAGSAAVLSAWGLAAAAVGFVLVWLGVALTTRAPYLALLRRAVTTGTPTRSSDVDPIDLESAEALVEYLAHDDPLVVMGAMSALGRRGRARLVPALVLLHDDIAVLKHALRLFGASGRNDWVTLARRLLTDPREGVRMAAARALAQHERLTAKDLAGDASARVRGYGALLVALGSPTPDAVDEPWVKNLLDLPGSSGDEARLGMLLAAADAQRDARLLRLLALVAATAGMSREWTEGLAQAASTQQAIELVPPLVARLVVHDAREELMLALVTLGPPALDELWKSLGDRTRPRALRTLLPGAIGRFGTKVAADLLLQTIESETDGLVRYKAIRGLGRMVADGRVVVDRVRVESLAQAALTEHFRLLGLRSPFQASAPHGATATVECVPAERLLLGLLDDKLRQSTERAFRLLKIAHPREDIHTVEIAARHDDKRGRANAGEFLDTLLRRHDQRSLRALLRVLMDDLSATERAALGGALSGPPAPTTREEAMRRLVGDKDPTIVAFAELYAASLAGEELEVAIPGPSGERRPVALRTGPAVGPDRPSASTHA